MRTSWPPAVLALVALGGCAASGPRFDAAASMARAAQDEWEETNRKVHAFNTTVDRLAVRPVAQAYRAVVPRPIRRGVNNFYTNLGEPLNFIHAIAQGKEASAARALTRFAMNGVLGGLGVADEATLRGLEQQPHDLGQTLAVWGMKSGPFVMLPVFGPSTLRDGIGFFGDFLLDPVRYGTNRILNPTQSVIEVGVQLANQRAELIERGEQIRLGSLDDYATVRSAWLQLRLAELYDGDPPIAEDDEDDAGADDGAADDPEPEAEPE
ncbi:MlaA family lipoprotein [Thermaurantiacus sp.]